jgi:hypothetical protein
MMSTLSKPAYVNSWRLGCLMGDVTSKQRLHTKIDHQRQSRLIFGSNSQQKLVRTILPHPKIESGSLFPRKLPIRIAL